MRMLPPPLLKRFTLIIAPSLILEMVTATVVNLPFGPPLPSVGVYENVAGASLPKGVSRTSVIVKSTDDGKLLADLVLHEGDKETSIGNLTLMRPLILTPARTPHQRYIKDNCYSLGRNDDLEEFQKFRSRGRIKNFQPHNTQLCVHGEGVDEKGHHLRADLQLGRIRGPAGLTAQYVIPMILRRAEEGDGGDVGSFGKILPSPLPSVGLYVNSADANLPTGVLKTSVSVRSK
ncbi:hypothetical protein FOZ62_004770 [Perkinsus olseni]|uniref:Uncharacterized protein n=2 Tax=Perkinsus olseni TaxID=32597 RepID=A0A7J6PYQ1_PEROL|nr:hypothetical protein FOZ62_004770 [Perkinsus olseni]